MEASALLSATHILEMRDICFCGVLAKRVDIEDISTDAKAIAKNNWETILKPGLLSDIKNEKTKVEE